MSRRTVAKPATAAISPAVEPADTTADEGAEPGPPPPAAEPKLADRVAAYLNASAKAADGATLLHDLRTRAGELSEEARQASERALDPSLGARDAEAEMKQADRAQFEAKRIVAAMAAVERRQEDLQAEETEAKWAGERERVIAERDVLAAELAQLWPAATAILVSLIDRMEANDRELRSTCGNLPTAETIARGFAPDVGGGPRPLARETKLPAFADRRGVPLWPRPPGSRIPPPIHFTLKEEPPIRYPVDVPPTRRQIV